MPVEIREAPDHMPARWVDQTWKPSHMSGWASYFMGWSGVLLGAYLLGLWVIETFTYQVSTDLFTYTGTLVVGLIFLGFGILGISMARNLANRARVIDFCDNKNCRITFWWRGRRKDIKFEIKDVESVEPCPKEKGIIDLLAKLPREPICYQVQVRGHPAFIVTGTDDEIHKVVKRFSSQNQFLQKPR